MSFTMSKLSLDPTQGSHTAENIACSIFDMVLGVKSTAKLLAGTWAGTSSTIWKTVTGAASSTKEASSKSYGTLRSSLGSSASRRMLGTCATAALCLTAPLLGAAAAGAAITCALITICMALLFLVLYTVLHIASQMLRCASLLLSMVCNILHSTFTATKSCLGGKSPARTTEERVAGDLDHKGVDSDRKHDAEKTEEKKHGLGSLCKSLAINLVSLMGTALVATPIILLAVVLLVLVPVYLLCATVHHIYQGNYEDRNNDKGSSRGGGTTYYPMTMSASASEESLSSIISEGDLSKTSLPSYSAATATGTGNETGEVSHSHSSGKSSSKPESRPESNLQNVVAETMSQQQRSVS
ncbi:invasion protein AipA [Anaplasma phagocytophilum]|uniref:invasion protein AipA n=1 Tax=Anaplasma phagocytophilum TaxID=948 RepID=UPI0012BD005D|nr:invasion protein AipA [Anaplasma phagocytophilum]